ncbi:MAG: Rpn family recombination-promoting nuclease/putative transposase, partial [Campylobacterota bacterium]|nr:Rpn family recombination-promoting nuclease/putative transposase [Campylobacterota bacterium]
LLELEDKIKDVEYRNLEKLGLNIVDRKAIFDIFCTDEKDNNFIVELQRSKQRYFKDRSVYYTSFPIQEQSKKGDWDYELNKVYFVGILEFEMDGKQDNPNYLTKVQLCNTETNQIFYDKLHYYYIEMPKFKKSETELKNHLEYWLYMLNNMATLEKIPERFKDDKLIEEAFNISEFLALSKEKQFAYQHDLKARLDYKNVMDYAIETAMEKGIQEGLEQGKIEIARKMLEASLDIETIKLTTDLSDKELQILKSKIVESV